MNERERLIELIDDFGDDVALCDVCNRPREDCEGCTNEQLAEYLVENGVVVLPCKVGDTVYEICERRRSGKWQKAIVERVVHGIEIGIDKILTARCGTTTYVYLSRLGETVFLTREEAEKALKGGEEE